MEKITILIPDNLIVNTVLHMSADECNKFLDKQVDVFVSSLRNKNDTISLSTDDMASLIRLANLGYLVLDAYNKKEIK